MPIVVDASCQSCGHRYVTDWPAGHALLHPVIVDLDTRTAYYDGKPWYANRFLSFIGSGKESIDVAITTRGPRQRSESAILVNCVDFLYGHALLKLFSVPRHLREAPASDVVAIVPKQLAWLVPAHVRVIEVDVSLPQADGWLRGLDDAVEEVLRGYHAISISPAVSQPRITEDDLRALRPELSPGHFWQGHATTQVCLVTRDDRLWFGNRNVALSAARRALPSKTWDAVSRVRQQRNFAALARILHRRRPDTRIVAAGLGDSGGLPSFVDDLRVAAPTDDDELRWLAEYAKSRVVVSVHGSNMLLPSALAGATVDLLPARKLPDLAEDLIVPEGAADPKLYLFRYRIIPEATSPRTVAEVVLSLFDDASFHYRNMVENRAAYEAPGWHREITWTRLNKTPALDWQAPPKPASTAHAS